MAFLGLFKKDVHYPSSHKKNNYVSPGSVLQKNLVREFYIKLDDPHRIWKPDECISGETILNLKKDVINVAIRLTLVGQVKVKSSVGGTTMRTKVTDKLLEKTTFLYGNEGDCQINGRTDVVNGLTQGEHIFPFKLRIPNGKKMFSSIKFERGSISYYLQCSLESIGRCQVERPVSKCTHFFLVMVPLDVSNLPEPKTKTVVLQSTSPVRPYNNISFDNGSSNTKTTGNSNTSNNTNSSAFSVSDKTVMISVDLSKAGYCIGEVIPVQVSLQHYKNFCHPAGLIVTLARICRVGSGGKDEPMETFRKDICQTIRPIYVDPETHACSVTAYLKVPIDTFSTFTSLQKFFTFQYYVEVMINLSQKNLILTESNRVVAGLHDGIKPGSSESLSGLEESLVSRMPRRLISMVSKSGSLNEENFDESSIIYKDMVNVERLKRMNNVTGMSIETVIGMTRSEESSPVLAEQSLHSAQSAQITQQSPIVEQSDTLPPSPDGQLFNARPLTNEWLAPLDAYPPVPEYTPNDDIKVIDDKRELEREKLKQLESDPPDNY
ncbi:ph-response sensor protein [Zygosaccharomyces mellis]|uniref:pH-response regulator protein palF/RIM8 n=1 Tax=Zygosaccharomyces mellis TaxID=42258 RepID=A0A4C2E998_9SACH|nr:ph-response sensor protein [Zygosaccharomyces mellis]